MDAVATRPDPGSIASRAREGSGFEVGAMAAAAERRRLGGAAIRTFQAIAERWRLGEAERLRLLGSPARSTYYGWVKAAAAGRAVVPSLDTMLRISAVLGIHDALGTLFASPADRLDWLVSPHRGAVFGGRPPLDLVTGGTQDGLLQVRRHLDAARGGLFAPPVDGPAGDALEAAPLADDDIVLL